MSHSRPWPNGPSSHFEAEARLVKWSMIRNYLLDRWVAADRVRAMAAILCRSRDQDDVLVHTKQGPVLDQRFKVKMRQDLKGQRIKPIRFAGSTAVPPHHHFGPIVPAGSVLPKRRCVRTKLVPGVQHDPLHSAQQRNHGLDEKNRKDLSRRVDEGQVFI